MKKFSRIVLAKLDGDIVNQIFYRYKHTFKSKDQRIMPTLMSSQVVYFYSVLMVGVRV